MAIWVPGTITSRIQPDLALAIDRGVALEIGQESFEWQVTSNDPTLPTDQTNLIVSVAETVDPLLVPHELTLTTTVRTGMGLGASLAATMLGIELAAALGDEPVPLSKKLAVANFFEPNRAAIEATLYGGCLVYNGPKNVLNFGTERVQGAIYLPDKVVETPVPPEPVKSSSSAQAVMNAMMSADGAWLATHFPLKEQVTADYFPHAEMVSRAVRAAGGFTTFVSANGPALVCLAETRVTDFFPKLKRQLTAGSVAPFHLSRKGVAQI
ncbi:hypothetical protein ACFQ3L_07995 [Lacticaseibacillus jixianensis]|uniref:Homoserine kinase n=1 Tax=Lacticaseibacillus jixianensis TaxID=2486012 RepID=A0ABW4BBC4_9LACO|nr:hypothetical protein [Lacticaseibacillus jixianensis]